MCSYCDRINYGLVSLHNEAALTNKTHKAETDESIFYLHDESGKEVAMFQFAACPICRRPLGQLGKDMFGDLRPYAVSGFLNNYAKNVIQTVPPDTSIVTPMWALCRMANKFNHLVRLYDDPSCVHVVTVDYYLKRLKFTDEYKDSDRFTIHVHEMGREIVNGVGLFEYTLNDKENSIKFVLNISRLEL